MSRISFIQTVSLAFVLCLSLAVKAAHGSGNQRESMRSSDEDNGQDVVQASSSSALVGSIGSNWTTSRFENGKSVFGAKSNNSSQTEVSPISSSLLRYRHRREQEIIGSTTSAPANNSSSTPNSASTEATASERETELLPASTEYGVRIESKDAADYSETSTADYGNKPEARNQAESLDMVPSSTNEPIILDHRPQADDEQQTSLVPDTQSPAAFEARSPPTSSPTTATGPSSSTSISSQTANLPQLQQQQSHVPKNGASYAYQWQQSPSNNLFYAQPQSLSGFNGPTNQVSASTILHPTSINSIISDQQNGNAVAMASGQQQIQVPLNGQQPTQVVLVGQAANGQMAALATGPNGRRISSITNWFKGLSTMLANIFNRREHGGQMQASGSAPSGHWIQLGPNAPHWLTQAQSAIQQFQQASNMAPSRFTSLIQAPSQLIQQQFQPSGNQLASQIQLQAQASSPSVAVAMSPQSGASLAQQQPTISMQLAQVGDMQASGSSGSYFTVQPVSSSQFSAQKPPVSSYPSLNQSQAPTASQQNQTATISRTSSGSTSTSIPSDPSPNQQQQQAITTSPSPPTAKRVTFQQSTGNGVSQIRFGRSSKGSPNAVNQYLSKAQSASSVKSHSQFNNDLPLAHYSTQYSMVE